MIVLYCHKCGNRSEFKKKKDMTCPCGHVANNRNRASDYVNMRNTWSGTTKIEFSNTTMEQDIADRNRR